VLILECRVSMDEAIQAEPISSTDSPGIRSNIRARILWLSHSRDTAQHL